MIPCASLTDRGRNEPFDLGFGLPSAWTENGTLVYHLGAGAPLSQLTWADRTGRRTGKDWRAWEPSANPAISPDQTRAAFDLANRRENNIDVWTYNLQNATSARFTFDPAEETTRVWSRDGRTIAYRAIGNPEVLRLKMSNGLQADTGLAKLPEGGSDFLPNSWSIDDRSIMSTVELKKGGSSLVSVSVSDGKITPFLQGGAKRNGQISPDGKWAAYESDETGDWEVFITSYPTAGGKLQVSRAGGKQPRWRGDGKEIYYIDPHGMLMAVPVSTEPGLSTGVPAALFPTNSRPYVSSTDLFTYDVSRDGNRFLVDRYYRPTTIPPLNIILGLTADAH